MAFLNHHPFTRSLTFVCLSLMIVLLYAEMKAYDERQSQNLFRKITYKQELVKKYKPLENVRENLGELQKSFQNKMATPLSIETLKEQLEKKIHSLSLRDSTFQAGASKEIKSGIIQDTFTLSWHSYRDQDHKVLLSFLAQECPGIFILSSFVIKKVSSISKDKIIDVATGSAAPFFRTQCTFSWIHKEPIL